MPPKKRKGKDKRTGAQKKKAHTFPVLTDSA